jgi:transcription-repair coupling factor (superfamily II helicase)
VLHTSASLAFRSLLKAAAARAGLAAAPPRLAGLTPPALAFHAAVVSQESPLVLVVAADTDVEQMTGDLRFLLASLQGWSAVESERRVLPLPSTEVDPYRGLAPHLEVASARARALHALATGVAQIVVTSGRAIVPRLPSPDRVSAAGCLLAPGTEISPADLAARLAAAGFTPEDPVDEAGEFCVRGGLVDLFPAGEPAPVRLEFVGDIIESVRRFDPATQRSRAALDQLAVPPQREVLFAPEAEDTPDRSATIMDFVRRAGASVVVYEPAEIARRGLALEAQWRGSEAALVARGQPVTPYGALALSWDEIEAWLAAGRTATELVVDQDGPAPARHVATRPALAFHGRIADWIAEVRAERAEGRTVVFVADTAGRAERTIEILRDYDIRAGAVGVADDVERLAVLVTTGHLSRGFHLPDGQLVLYAETDLFEEERRVHERRRAHRSFSSDFRDLKVGDLVVHVDNGIGRFVGLKTLAPQGGQADQEFMELRYAGEDKLFVPLDRLDLVQKYTGGAAPALDRLGGTTWEKAKTRVKKAMRDMADELLKLYAARKAVVGHAFSPDSHWQQEFGDAFAYDLTPDQSQAIADITRDLEAPTPMDRLLCGDVGYGKTEVAMRAAFKAVIDGKQVAVLAPTTVLAFQHLRTLRERFAGFPVRIELVSRFRTRLEQQEALTALAAGQVDIIVGTHRLLSKDVVFRDLGLLVVDEEQRFGVAHKERLKQLRRKVDVLTMTATPIPRTLNMSLAGIRDMSVIETPPRDRLSIQTHVVPFDADVIQRAIRTELERGGQVYLVHNRVESIASMASLVTRLVPDARIRVGHGQMSEEALERVMVDFVAHTFDVLLATTIVENGLDIPNANTIIINRADRYGLAQLYQLRGRVGRSDRRAYAYLLIPDPRTLSPVARRRLAAIREFSDLGSGFRIAALDLEIRGAGNLLGGEQSGHIEAVGFDMYVKLLDETIRELKGEELDDDRRAAVNLRLHFRIDALYIPDMNQRLTAYRRLASARTEADLEALAEELRDRYGPLPESVEHLVAFAGIRIRADRVGVESIDRDGPVVVLKFRPDAPIDPAVLLKMIRTRKDLTLVPPAVLRLDLVINQNQDAKQMKSWWTSRANAKIESGFSRSSLTAERPFDPAAPGGLFERVRTLLAELSQALVAN